MRFNRRSIVTLVGAIFLAGAVIVGGIYGPTAWKVFRGDDGLSASGDDQVVIQSPPINYGNSNSTGEESEESEEPEGTESSPITGDAQPQDQPAPAGEDPADQPNNDNSANPDGMVKYKEPDLSLMNLAPSVEEYFGEDALSDAARTLAYGAAWNIHQYVDGYLFGITAGPQMNEEDIKKYIVFHKTLWDKQMQNEPNTGQSAAFSGYVRNLLNRGIDAFDCKDKIRIEQFHQEIHDLDTHLFRDDMSSKTYGATPFSTKRSE